MASHGVEAARASSSSGSLVCNVHTSNTDIQASSTMSTKSSLLIGHRRARHQHIRDSRPHVGKTSEAFKQTDALSEQYMLQCKTKLGIGIPRDASTGRSTHCTTSSAKHLASCIVGNPWQNDKNKDLCTRICIGFDKGQNEESCNDRLLSQVGTRRPCLVPALLSK